MKLTDYSPDENVLSNEERNTDIESKTLCIYLKLFRIHKYLGHYQSTNFIEHNSSGEANISKAREEITPHFMEHEVAKEAAMCFGYDAN